MQIQQPQLFTLIRDLLASQTAISFGLVINQQRLRFLAPDDEL